LHRFYFLRNFAKIWEFNFVDSLMIEILREFNIAYEGDLDFSREIIFVDLTKVVKVIKVAKVVKGGGGGHFLRLTQNWIDK